MTFENHYIIYRCGFFKVQEKFSASDISWNRAMDEVRTDRLMAKYGKDCLLVIIRDWPVSAKYKDKPELVASLEYLVCLVNIHNYYMAAIVRAL